MDGRAIREAIDSLRKNNFTVHYFENSSDAVAEIFNQLRAAKSISRGGSVTIEQIGLIKKIVEAGLPFRDYVSSEDRMASLTAEYYLAGTNSITQDGKLVNVDGSGNRVAAMSFGPGHVFIVAGTNKIVKDETAAIERIRTVAAPLNARRLNKKTPCVKTGKCEDCQSAERICRKQMTMTKPEQGRVTIFLINENLGY